jgi:RNA polymerase sigma-70 factor (ECF subfamily)
MSALSPVFATGREAHPQIALQQQVFEAFLRRLAEDVPGAGTNPLHAADLYLACACAEQVDGAAAAFEARFASVIGRAVARVLGDACQCDEAVQQVRERLLVGGADGKPKIGNYRGDGPLESWVAVASIRCAVSMGRSLTAERRLRAKAMGEVAGADPELLLMKGQLRRELELAVAAGLDRLEQRERLVLRLYLVSGMTLAAIGCSLGISQSSVSRQVAQARDCVLAEVRQRLADRLKLDHSDLHSVYRLVASRLDVSLSRLLGAA